jgi:DNA-binding transcriptional LysR family regulator
MRVFVTVVDRGSLSAAAGSLETSLPSVSRSLAGLERELGVRLLTRTNRGLVQTDCGLVYYRKCQQVLADVRDADAAAQSHAHTTAGTLRVTAPVTFGRHHVAPGIAEFLEKYPRVSAYLSLTDHVESLPEQRLDLAIRVSALRDESLTARRLGYVQRTVVGAPIYFGEHGVPRQLRDLERHECLRFTHYSDADEWHFVESGHALTVRISGRLHSNNQDALVDAVLAGAGLAVLPTWLVREYIETGRMQRVLTEFEAPRTPVYAVLPTRGPPPKKVSALIDFLAERYERHQVLTAAPG